MKQQINLLLELPNLGGVKFNFVRFIQLICGLIILLLIIYLFKVWDDYSLNKNVNLLQNQSQTLKNNILIETAKLAKILNTEQLQQEIKQLNEMMKSKLLAAEKLGGIDSVNTAGFSSYLTQLAEVVVNGVWLKRIILQKGGSEISLVGLAQNSALVKQYANQLLKLPVLKDKSFRLFKIQSEVDDQNQVKFTLSTDEAFADG